MTNGLKKQENRQAAKNNPSPPVLVTEAKMREISFKSTFRDWQEAVRVSLLHMTPFYWAVWSGCLLLMTVGLIMILWSQGYPATWPPTQLPPRSVLLSLGSLIGIILLAPFSTIIVYGCLFRSRTVQISPKSFAFKYGIWVNQTRWKNVTAIVDTGAYFCFCQNFPSVAVVPRSAFPDSAQANAFLEEATYYWRRETGRSDPPAINAKDVWPPAPRFGA